MSKPPLAKRLRAGLMGLKTILGWQQQGFFIPYRYADKVPIRAEATPYTALLPIFERATPTLQQWLQAAETYADRFAEIGTAPPPAPRWQQSWFPTLDAAIAYTFVRMQTPKHIIEIGSGHSTRFMAQAIADGRLLTKFTAIDPQPRAAIATLPVHWLNEPFSESHIELVEQLAADDILFVDSSHILMPGSDVDLLINAILPSLKAGVLVHFHDCFLPYPYPAAWHWRGYNEQNALGALLSAGWGVAFSSAYVLRHMSDSLAGSVIAQLPTVQESYPSSLWLLKRVNPPT